MCSSLEELCNRLGVKCVASQVDFKTGKYYKPSCKGEQKVIQFREKYPDIEVGASYGNAQSDKYIIAIGKKGFLIKNHSEKAVTMWEITEANRNSFFK